MKKGDRVVVVKPFEAEHMTDNGTYWCEGMDKFIGTEAVIVNTSVITDQSRTEQYILNISRFIWKAEWLKPIPKEMTMDEVINTLDVYLHCDHDEYSAAISYLVDVYSFHEMYSFECAEAIEKQLRGSLMFFQRNYEIKQRTVEQTSYIENYLEEK